MSPKALIFGTGSVGSVYGYLLCKALGEKNVTAICRSNYEVASQNGFTINSTIFGNNLSCKPNVVRSVNEAQYGGLGPFDYVIVAAKALPVTPSIPSLLKPAVSPNTAMVLIQNGVGIEAIYADAFPNNPILSCVTYLPVTQTSPAVFTHKEVEKLHVGTFPHNAPADHKYAAERLVSLINSVGATAVHHDDVGSQRWAKLLVNASWNPICALARSRDAQFMATSPEATAYVRDVMLEITSIAQAIGYNNVSNETVDWQMSRAKARSLPGIEPSMMADAMAGRETEADAIVGNAVKIAEANGVKVPLLTANYALLKALNESFKRERDSG
jgi:2-dehydropantoate 2-reductase